MLDPDVLAIQRAYPQVYFACHLAHVRAASSPYGISERESLLLGHLDRARPTFPAALARHMGIGGPALSALVKKLSALGLLEVRRGGADGRRRPLYLTGRGEEALSAVSILDAALLERLLGRLTPAERRAAVRGLTLLARAGRELSLEKRREKESA